VGRWKRQQEGEPAQNSISAIKRAWRAGPNSYGERKGIATFYQTPEVTRAGLWEPSWPILFCWLLLTKRRMNDVQHAAPRCRREVFARAATLSEMPNILSNVNLRRWILPHARIVRASPIQVLSAHAGFAPALKPT